VASGLTSGADRSDRGTRPRHEVVRGEIFGPLVVPPPPEHPDDIEPTANDSPYGLAPYLDKDISKATLWPEAQGRDRVDQLATTSSTPALPFGGYRQSGWGREMGTKRSRPIPSQGGLRPTRETAPKARIAGRPWTEQPGE